jgi:hypothetical protein
LKVGYLTRGVIYKVCDDYFQRWLITPLRAIALMSSGDGGLARVARHGQKLLAGLHINLPGGIQNQSLTLDQLANVLPRPPLQLAVLLASYKSHAASIVVAC